ncbi:MAG TPA: hypothetical protein VGN63_24105 [Flavisolibacter sp.]|jgi:hypothetical protein|nr:hypothetical protein [Flavisolibacter sp.]
MDRYLSSSKRKRRFFKEFEWLDLIPYSIALLLLGAEISILCRFLQIYQNISD